MILADKIINERKKNGWSQEELAEMLDVSRQSVSKWEGAQSVPDLTRIIKMAEIFGVTTDYLLKDELEPEDTTNVNFEHTYAETPEYTPKHVVTMEEAIDYIETRKRCLPKIGFGVALCITCPLVMMVLLGLSTINIIASEAAVAVGLLFIFAQVGIAISLFIRYGMKVEKYEFLEKEQFETAYGVDGMVKEKMAAAEAKNISAITVGVLLCVCCPVPLVMASIMNAGEVAILCLVGLLLLIVAVAVYLFVSVCGVYSSYKILLQDGDYTPAKKDEYNRDEGWIAAYWLLVVAAYLAVSFLLKAWGISWLIWPIAGVVFAAIKAIVNSVSAGRRNR